MPSTVKTSWLNEGSPRAGGYIGARLQSPAPDVLICRLVRVLVIAIGAYLLSSGLG